MMVRKRLSDMVRQETEKSSMAEVEIVPDESVVMTESTALPTTSENQERSLQEKVLQLQAELKKTIVLGKIARRLAG